MAEAAQVIPRCGACGTELSTYALACPGCRKLVHGEELKRLAAEAKEKAAAGDRTAALSAWRHAQELLPEESGQHAAIQKEILALSAALEAFGTKPASEKKPPLKTLAALGAAGLFLWKFKFIGAFLLTKGKFLLFGLTKAGTVLSMLGALSLYWATWGLPFAAGVLACIYVHEMGHVWALRRLGIAAGAPMFVPGLGAFVRLKQYPANAREDARVGLAGPVWGMFAALAFVGAGLASGHGALLAIGKTAAWLNLFNLVPVWQLDGSRGFRALSRNERFILLGVLALAWFMTEETMLLVVGLVAGGRTFMSPPSEEGDRRALVEFAGVALVLAALAVTAADALPVK